MPDLSLLEAKLGHDFKERTLLVRALTHRSALATRSVSESDRTGRDMSYQRLEFMGDRILAFVIAEMLLTHFPDAEEGELARRLTGLVRNETCAEVADECGLPACIILGDGERRAGGRQKAAIIGDVCEAVIAAIYFDGGMDPARRFVDRYWRPRMESWTKPLRDPKTALQEWAHGLRRPTPLYHEISRTGPDHALSFVMEVRVEGTKPSQGSGNSKREAEQKAASAFLVREGIWEQDDHD